MRSRNGRNGRPASQHLRGGGQVRAWNVPDTLNTGGHLAMSCFAVSSVSSFGCDDEVVWWVTVAVVADRLRE